MNTLPNLFTLKQTTYKILLLSIPFFFFIGLNAQDFPTPIVGNDLVKSGVTNASPGKGLSVEYFLHPSYDLNNNFDGTGDKQRTDVDSKKFIETKLKIPLANRDDFRMLLGFSHTYEKYEFNKISAGSSFLVTR